MLCYQYIVTALKVFVYNNIVCLYLQTLKNVVKIVVKDTFCICITVILVIFKNLC